MFIAQVCQVHTKCSLHKLKFLWFSAQVWISVHCTQKLKILFIAHELVHWRQKLNFFQKKSVHCTWIQFFWIWENISPANFLAGSINFVKYKYSKIQNNFEYVNIIIKQKHSSIQVRQIILDYWTRIMCGFKLNHIKYDENTIE